MRRLVATLLLFTTIACQVEAVAGEVRDGGVHHEDATTAVNHSHSQSEVLGHHHVDHHDASAELPAPSHERVDDASTASQGDTDCEHGSAADHCMHVHGVALVPSLEFELVHTEIHFEFSTSHHHRDRVSAAHSPPPKPSLQAD